MELRCGQVCERQSRLDEETSTDGVTPHLIVGALPQQRSEMWCGHWAKGSFRGLVGVGVSDMICNDHARGLISSHP